VVKEYNKNILEHARPFLNSKNENENQNRHPKYTIFTTYGHAKPQILGILFNVLCKKIIF